MIKEFPRPEHGYTLFIDTETKEQWQVPTADRPEPVFHGDLTKEATNRGPNTARKIANYARARVQHSMAGKPKASPAQIKKRYEICKSCPDDLYQVLDSRKTPSKLIDLAEVGTCKHKKCGCYIHPDPELTPNKLSWADQSCPKGHWARVEKACEPGCC